MVDIAVTESDNLQSLIAKIKRVQTGSPGEVANLVFEAGKDYYFDSEEDYDYITSLMQTGENALTFHEGGLQITVRGNADNTHIQLPAHYYFHFDGNTSLHYLMDGTGTMTVAWANEGAHSFVSSFIMEGGDHLIRMDGQGDGSAIKFVSRAALIANEGDVENRIQDGSTVNIAINNVAISNTLVGHDALTSLFTFSHISEAGPALPPWEQNHVILHYRMLHSDVFGTEYDWQESTHHFYGQTDYAEPVSAPESTPEAAAPQKYNIRYSGDADGHVISVPMTPFNTTNPGKAPSV